MMAGCSGVPDLPHSTPKAAYQRGLAIQTRRVAWPSSPQWFQHWERFASKSGQAAKTGTSI